uniref:Uncharacterized protein n=1 Tax=Romanomermis culicivorax TaxID=13658 RepID=A0A915IZ04_ROMCU
PVSVWIFNEAVSATLTVFLTHFIKFSALKTNCCIASSTSFRSEMTKEVFEKCTLINVSWIVAYGSCIGIKTSSVNYCKLLLIYVEEKTCESPASHRNNLGVVNVKNSR